MTEKKIPLRRCTGCNESFPKKDLIRVLKTPEGDIILDSTGRKNGRGAYLCKNVECFNKARKSKSLERSLGVSIPNDIYEELQKEMISLG
ncbi:MAG: YlxR family protein [Lachnospiraceae bacterium]|nr:YlxR family protein [Lachnospiraceae bacterium]